MRIVDAETGAVITNVELATFSGSLGQLDVPSGAFQIQLGCLVDGDLDRFDARATSTLATNPDHTAVTLEAAI